MNILLVRFVSIFKNGRYKGKQRFICRKCGVNFNSLTNSPMAMTHKLEKWPLFIECLVKGMSLRAAGAEIGVSYVTLFYWRHKLMRALKSREKISFDGDVEADDTLVAYSEKGSRKISDRKPKKNGTKYTQMENKKVLLLVVVDHNNHLFLEASSTKNTYVTSICNSLGDLVSKEAKFCSNFKTFYKHFAKLKGIEHHFRVSLYHNTVENNIDLAYGHRKAVENWFYRFQGVASKYLNNYLALYNCLRKNNLDKTAIGVTNFLKALSFVNIKESYKSIRTLKLI